MKRLLLMLATLAALALGGCATPTPKVDLKAGTLKPGQVVALVEPPAIDHYFIYAPHPGMAFGAIGGLVAGAHFEARAKEVGTIVAQHGFVPHAEIADAFRRDLEAAGYRVEVIRGVWKREGNVMRLDVARIPASYDRLLVLTPALLGFYAKFTANYVPSLRLRVALYGTDREKPLYDGWHITGLEPPGQGWIIVPPVQTAFTSYEAMIAQPAGMVDALRTGIGNVTRSAMRDLGARATARAPRPDDAQLRQIAGAWAGSMKCGEYTGRGTTENPAPWSQRVKLVVDAGRAEMTRGGASQNYEERVSGDVRAGLTVIMQGQGAMHRSADKPWYTEAAGKFEPEAGRFAGTATLRSSRGEQIRSCTLELTRAPA